MLTHTIHLELFAIRNPLKVLIPSNEIKLYTFVPVLGYYILIFVGSCADFGSSGSGVVREWKKYDERPSVDFGVDYVDGSDTGEKEEHYQYSFVGPLSMSKGCDLSLDIAGKDYDPELDNVEFIYRGIIENLIFLMIIF